MQVEESLLKIRRLNHQSGLITSPQRATLTSYNKWGKIWRHGRHFFCDFLLLVRFYVYYLTTLRFSTADSRYMYVFVASFLFQGETHDQWMKSIHHKHTVNSFICQWRDSITVWQIMEIYVQSYVYEFIYHLLCPVEISLFIYFSLQNNLQTKYLFLLLC